MLLLVIQLTHSARTGRKTKFSKLRRFFRAEKFISSYKYRWGAAAIRDARRPNATHRLSDEIYDGEPFRATSPFVNVRRTMSVRENISSTSGQRYVYSIPECEINTNRRVVFDAFTTSTAIDDFNVNKSL